MDEGFYGRPSLPYGMFPPSCPPIPWSPALFDRYGQPPPPALTPGLSFLESPLFRDMPPGGGTPYHYPPDPRMNWCGTPSAAYMSAQERALMMGPLESPRGHPGLMGMRMMEGFPTG
mmetsp:Transcript_34762/g.45977  ORF Transcript_34762/g.45977 Transcript_34762/m.45977 type:complete len:117 (+) Transcript_34762:1-351(+)